MNKKIIFIIIGTLVIAGLLILVFVPRKEPPQISPPGAGGQGGVIEMVNLPEKAFYPILSLDQKNIFYLPGQDFSLKEFNLEKGKSQLVSPPYFGFVENIVWSSQKDKLIVWVENNKEGLKAIQSPLVSEGGEEKAVFPYLYDLKTKTSIPLSSNKLLTATFVENGQKIVYQFRDENTNTLNLADPDGKNWKKIIDLKEEKIFLATLGENEIVYATQGSTDTFNVIKPDGSGPRTIKLSLSVNPQKIAWSSDSSFVVVAIRETNEKNDSFSKISLETGEKTKIDYSTNQPTDFIDAQNLLLDSEGKTLYFISNNILYQLTLK